MDEIEALAPPGTEAISLLTGAASAATLSYYRRRGYLEVPGSIPPRVCPWWSWNGHSTSEVHGGVGGAFPHLHDDEKLDHGRDFIRLRPI